MRKPIKGEGGIFPPFGRYHHGMEVTGAERLLFLSGQLPFTLEGKVPAGMTAQAELVFANIDTLLNEAGMRRINIVRLTTFLLDPAHRGPYMDVRDRWVEAPAPASTLLFVSGLAHPDALIEIEAIAAS